MTIPSGFDVTRVGEYEVLTPSPIGKAPAPNQVPLPSSGGGVSPFRGSNTVNPLRMPPSSPFPGLNPIQRPPLRLVPPNMTPSPQPPGPADPSGFHFEPLPPGAPGGNTADGQIVPTDTGGGGGGGLATASFFSRIPTWVWVLGAGAVLWWMWQKRSRNPLYWGPAA